MTLECTHEVYLDCIINILKQKPLICPMCRRKYNISILNEPEKQEEKIPHEYIINIFPQNENDLRSLIIRDHVDDQCNFYEVFVIHGEILYQYSFMILHSTTTTTEVN